MAGMDARKNLEDVITTVPTPTRREVTDWVLQSIAKFEGTQIRYNSWRHGEYAYFPPSLASRTKRNNTNSNRNDTAEENIRTTEHITWVIIYYSLFLALVQK
jgi:hypothetical protein